MRIIVMVTLLAVLFLNACATNPKLVVELMPEEELGVIEWRDGSKEQAITAEEAKRLSDELCAQKNNLFLVAKKIYCKHEEWSFDTIYLEFHFKPPEELENKAKYILVTLRNTTDSKRIYICIMAIVEKDISGFRLPSTPQWMEWAKKQIEDYESEVAKEWKFKKRN